MAALEILDKFGKRITLDDDKKNHILSRPEMRTQEHRIEETLSDPEEIRESLKDKSIWLYYKKYSKTPVTEKYMLVIVKVLNSDGKIITSFFTDRIKKGELIWKKN